MGAEQGDNLGNEVLYLHPENPEWGDRPAYTPADRYNLEARGWVRKNLRPRQAAPSKSADSAS